MKRLLIVAALVVLAACSGGDSSGATTSSTLFVGQSFGGGGGGGDGGEDSPSTSDEPDTSDVESDSNVEGEGACVSGVYELDSADLWTQISAASPEGGTAEVLSGSVTLELREDSSAVVSMNAWSFRLFFPDQADTVVATQTGQMTGSWSVDDEGVPSVSFASNSITGAFVLETPDGTFPVPSATQPVALPEGVELVGECDTDFVILPALDTQLGTTIEWVFYRP